ncbi:MAG: carboxylating nicotinate-nucleotide diphosphorylase [Candidatus Gracilibacteria bacterium]|nr:carboxylating nicotinate-nucleotide diphosphorylase [Candidatus Gracilibacteria bacterium]
MDIHTELQQLIELAYAEDGDKDITSDAVCAADDEREAIITAKQDGVVCGIDFFKDIVKPIDEGLVFEPFLDKGMDVKERMMIGAVTGKVSSLLRIERVFLNFLSRLSGIATHTKKFVDELEGTNVMVLDTRKTVPGWRFLDKYAVTVGGGINHRMGLHDVALLKDTHVDYCGGVLKAIQQFRAKDAESHLIVEVRNLAELSEAITESKSFTRLLLDNFSIEDLRKAVEISAGKVVLEASGGITLENVREVAETGIHFVSVGALTHSSAGFDYSLQISQ